MTNKFLLNLLGFNPDLTSRKPLPDSVSIPCRVRVLGILLVLLTIGVGEMWGAVPKTTDLDFGTPAVNANFEAVSETSTSNNTSSAVTNNSLSGFGPFSASYLGKNQNGVQSIAIVDGSADDDDPMDSKYFKMTSTNNGSSVTFAHTNATGKGAFSFKITKTSKLQIGLYNGSASGSMAHDAAAAFLSFDGGSTIKISAGRNGKSDPSPKGWQTVSSSLPSADVLDITVVYNTTESSATYGDDISLAANSAHVYVNGTAKDDGAGNASDFYIGGNTIAHFRLFDNTTGSKSSCVDDIKIYNALPNAAETCTELASINGSVSWTNPTEAVLTWNSMSNVHASTPYTIKYKTHDAGAYTTFDGSITTNGSGKKTCTITGLSCNTAYDFKIEVTAASGYCDKDSVMENKNSGKWSVTYNLENVSKTSGPDAGANVCGDYSAVFAANSGSALPSSITVTGASSYTWTKATGALSISSANITGNLTITITGACTAFSLHTGTKSGSDWVTNKCFGDVDWGAVDDAIWEGEFPSTNECYVGWQGSTSDHGTYWAVGGIKTYDIPTGRTLGWNSGNYYQDYPANAYGTFHIYKNSSDENSYLRFKPSAYVLRTGTDGTSWSSTAMTKSATNDHYYETAGLTLTSTLIDEHAYVALSANNVNGYVWCNFSSDVTAENNVKVKVGYGDEDAKFRATNLADGDAGKYGKFRIDVTKDVNNWKLAFVPMYKITYAAGTGATGSMDPSAYQEIGGTIAAAAEGFTDPTYKQFAGWSGSDGNDYAAGANVTMNSDVTLTAQWTDIPVTALTISESSLSKYVGEPNVTLSISSVTPSGANPAVTWSSSDATVASVTPEGVVSFLKAGSATITATSNITGTTKVTCTVNVYSVTLVVNGDDDVALAGGGIPTMTFTASTRTISTSETGNYVFKSLTQSGGSWSTSPSTTTGTTTAVLAAATANVTVTATYYKPRTVTWNIWEDNSHVSEVKYNTEFQNISDGKPVLDTDFDDDALDACGSNKFIGWVKASGEWTGAVGKTSTWYESNKPSASDAITSNTNYYAMFATASNFADNAYDLNNSGSLNSNWEKTTTRSAARNETYAGKTYTWQVYGESSSVLGEINTTNTYTNVSGFKLLVAASNATTVKLYYSANKSSWEEADSKSVSANSSSYTEYVFDVSSVPSSAVYLKITNSVNSLYIKTATITTGTLSDYRTGCTVTCSRPTPASPTSIGKTGATISWSAGSNGTPASYDYKVWAEGDDEPVSGTNTTSTSVTLSGLYSGVTYHWKVKANCSGGDGESIWATGSDFTTTDATLTFSVPTGATAVDPSTTATNLPEADAPTDCGNCWAFVGWTTAAYAENSSAPATLFPAGTKAKVSGDATLYAVYTKSTYRIISALSEIDADEYYVISVSQTGVTSAMGNTVTATYFATEEEMPIKEDNTGAYIESPDEDAVWKFTGTTSAGRFQNVGNDKYMDLSDYELPPLADATSDFVNITVLNASAKTFDIESNTTDGNYLQLYSKGWGVDDEHDGYFSCRLFKRAGSTYTTELSCPKYTVTFSKNGSTHDTKYVTACDGYLSATPSDPNDNTLDVNQGGCITNGKGTFMGWSPTRVVPAQDEEPDELYYDLEDFPEIKENTTFYAVFAEEKTGSVAATNKTYTFTSKAWADSESAWTSGADGNALTSGRGVQVTKGTTGANATTKDSYDDVTKVTVTYSTNASTGTGTIDIKVNGTSYTAGGSVTTSGGTSDRTIDFTPPSSALDGAVKITVTCSDNSIYIKSVKIYYTGSTTTYEGYRTACCDDADFKFVDATPAEITEYTIVREDLSSSSDYGTWTYATSSSNTTGTISWASTARQKSDNNTAFTWSPGGTNQSPTGEFYVDVANTEIKGKRSGVYVVTLSQASGGTTYCDENASITITVKTVDKFIDAVNGNFSGEAQRLEDTGNGITLPTEATFSTNDGCESTARRLIGWIRASDLATYASGGRVNTIDDLKTSDASNKVIAPGTKVQATGVTWYAVWGVEK